MLNQVVLVGRIVNEVELKEIENGKKIANITLAIPRTFKNADGVYETDFINCIVYNNIAESLKEYCVKGDLVGAKGSLRSEHIENEDGTSTYKMMFVADKITFLSSKKSETNE